MKPFFSVITCVYNSEKFLERNLISVKNQTFKNYEQIIVYSPSKDGSRKIISKYKRNNKKIRLVSIKPCGISPAFNKGISAAKGVFLIFLNSDDYFYDNNVLKGVSVFLKHHKNADWIYGIINVVDENEKNIGIFPKFKLFKAKSISLLKYINYIPHQSVFIKREIFNKLGTFDEKLSSQMDYEYWLRIAKSTRWSFFEKIISNYTIRKGAKSSSKKNYEENISNMRSVQGRYLNSWEMLFAGIVEKIVKIYNKTTR